MTFYFCTALPTYRGASFVETQDHAAACLASRMGSEGGERDDSKASAE